MAALPFHITTKLNELTPFSLQYMADCGSPDSATSPGAAWLTRVAASTVEHVEYGVEHVDLPKLDDDDMRDAVHEIADGAVPIYTHELWSVFVDVAAYHEDISEYGAEGSDLTKSAQVALYMIAERLIGAVLSFIAEAAADDPEVEGARVRAAGATAGRNAAEWWCQNTFGGRAPGDVAPTAQHVLDGIADGDPAVLDALPSLDLSGQWADGLTEADVLSDVDLDPDDLEPEAVSFVLDQYRDAFDGAVVEYVEDVARSVVASAL